MGRVAELGSLGRFTRLAMPDNSQQVATAVERFVAFLRSLDGDDQERGTLAAQNIECSLAVLRSDFTAGLARLQTDIGGKGVLDWVWSDKHRTEIERFSDDIHTLINAA